MKTPKIFAAAVLGLASLAMTSCEDWLTIYPQDKLTDEQFWEDLNDLEGVRYAAYRNFASGDVVKKILVWGELRSDNVVFSGMSSANEYNSMLRLTDGRLDTASSYNDWATFYTTINYCNQVLHNIDKVQKRDPQFTKTQKRRMEAEMYTLRALNYFYLVRAFGNVPYVNTVIKTDAEVKIHKQAFQSDILDSLINDVDRVKDDIRLYYASSEDTRALITKPMAYALLADLCLWRGAKYEGKGEEFKREADSLYWRAYEYAVRAREIMDDPDEGQYTAIYVEDERSIAHMGKYYLEQNFPKNSQDKTPAMNAFKALYQRGFSDESIFEMPFTQKDEQTNGTVNSYFGIVTNSSGKTFYSNYAGLKLCSPKSKDGGLYDLRLLYTTAYFDNTSFLELNRQDKSISSSANGYMMKYHVFDEFKYEPSSDNKPYFKLFFESTDNDYNNFIIYRKSDVLFMEAEAIALLKILNGEHAASVDLKDARVIVAEHRRRNYIEYREFAEDGKGDYMPTDELWGNAEKVLTYVLDEKQIEFVGEGKRWFDIVRYMERAGAKSDKIGEMFSVGAQQGSFCKHEQKAQRYKAGLRARWAFYNPVYYPEREASGWVLYQNPYWDDDPTNNDPANGEPVEVAEEKPQDEPETPADETGNETGDQPEDNQPEGGETEE